MIGKHRFGQTVTANAPVLLTAQRSERTLYYKLVDHPVELGAGIRAAADAQRQYGREVGHRLGRGVAEQPDFDASQFLASHLDVQVRHVGDRERLYGLRAYPRKSNSATISIYTIAGCTVEKINTGRRPLNVP